MDMNISHEYTKQASDLFARGMFWLNRKDYEAALADFLECHRHGYRKTEIEEIVEQHFYEPHRENFKNNYLANVALLSDYPNINQREYPSFDELNYQFIPSGSSRFIIYDRKEQTFICYPDMISNFDLTSCRENSIILIVDEHRLDRILSCEQKSREAHSFLWMKTPQYLFYHDFDKFVQYLQVYDISSVLATRRVVFLFGPEELERFFSCPQALFPELIINIRDQKGEGIIAFIKEKLDWTKGRISELQEKIAKHYTSISREELMEKMKNGKPRILFLTSRFTTALQHYTRDCALACDRLGIPNQVLKEKSDVHRVTLHERLEVLNDFRPDIVFSIDHFRWEQPYLPENVIFVSWVQDLLPNITSRHSAAQVGPLDFVLNVFVSHVRFLLDLGYPRDAIIEAPFAANSDIYRYYSLSRKEKEIYSTDICAFSNTGNPRQGLGEFLKVFSAPPGYTSLEEILLPAFWDMYARFYREDIFYSLDDYQVFLLEYLRIHNLNATGEYLNQMAQVWREEVGWRIFRSLPLEWLHEKGYRMKLWGREWNSHPLLGVHAQGVAANGEILSRIINASKIIIGTSPLVTTHPRVFETIMSNSFYLAYRIPEEHDWANIREYLQEDREIVFAYSREDLYQKVDYYLANQDERKKVIRRAKAKIKKNLTYEALITRVVKEIAKKLKD